MAGYTAVFSSIYDGTLYGRWPAAAVFASLLPLADKNGEVDMSLQAIAGRTGWPLDLLEEGIRQLVEPDPGSRSDTEDGRRLVLLNPEKRNWGWRFVNHAAYREKARKQAQQIEFTASGRDAERKRIARERHNKESSDVQSRPAESGAVRPSDSDADSREDPTAAERPTAKGDPPEFDEFKSVYPARLGSQPWPRALKAARARLREGHTWAEMIAGAKRYAAHLAATSKLNTEFVKQAATFLGPDKAFLEPFETGPKRYTLAEATRPDGTLDLTKVQWQ